MRKHYVLKNKQRFFSFLILMSILLSSVFFASSVYGNEIRQYDTIVVDSGDTLWDIAREYNNSSGDIRKLIAEIKKINNLQSSVIFAGDELLIPHLTN